MTKRALRTVAEIRRLLRPTANPPPRYSLTAAFRRRSFRALVPFYLRVSPALVPRGGELDRHSRRYTNVRHFRHIPWYKLSPFYDRVQLSLSPLRFQSIRAASMPVIRARRSWSGGNERCEIFTCENYIENFIANFLRPNWDLVRFPVVHLDF